MYGNRVNVLMMANMLHVRFVGRNCSVDCRGGSTSALRKHGTRRRPLVAQQTNVYTIVIEISVILIKQSLYD